MHLQLTTPEKKAEVWFSSVIDSMKILLEFLMSLSSNFRRSTELVFILALLMVSFFELIAKIVEVPFLFFLIATFIIILEVSKLKPHSLGILLSSFIIDNTLRSFAATIEKKICKEEKKNALIVYVF